MKKPEEMTLEECRAELAKRIELTHMTEWQNRRLQELTYRIHELDPSETIKVKWSPK